MSFTKNLRGSHVVPSIGFDSLRSSYDVKNYVMNDIAKKLNSLFYVSKEHDETRFELLYTNLVQLVVDDKLNNFSNFLNANIFGIIEVLFVCLLFFVVVVFTSVERSSRQRRKSYWRMHENFRLFWDINEE